MTLDRADLGVLLVAAGFGFVIAGAWLISPALAVVAGGLELWWVGLRAIRL